MKAKTIKSAKKNTKNVSANTLLNMKFTNGSVSKKFGTIYSTTEENFTVIVDNRGRVKGYDDKRVNGLMHKIELGLFIWLFSTIKVIYKRGTLYILDGANRVTAIRKLIEEGKLDKNYQIPFVVINDPKLQKMTKNDLIEFMAGMNDYDPRWKEQEHYDAALSANLLTALKFDEFLRKIKTSEIRNRLTYINGGSSRTIRVKYNLLLSLATRTPVKNNGTKVIFADFRNDDYGNYMKTTAFENDFNSLIDFLEIAKEWQINNNVRVSKSIFRALDIVYNDGIKVEFEYLVKQLKKAGNKMPKNDSDIKPFLTKIIFN